MMVCFMRFFKKISIIATIFFILLLIMNRFSYSEENKILIKDVVINNNNNLNYISFNQEISLDYLIREAIDKGIPLVFKITLRIVEIHNILPTKTIKTEVSYYQIKYKALRKIYEIIGNYRKIIGNYRKL